MNYNILYFSQILSNSQVALSHFPKLYSYLIPKLLGTN